MRSIVCRFKDEADFRLHLRPGFGRRSPSFTIVTDMNLEAGSSLEIVALVANFPEELRAGITVFEKTRVVVDDEFGGPLYRYVCVVDASDAVWVKMFTQKLSMFADLRQAA